MVVCWLGGIDVIIYAQTFTEQTPRIEILIEKIDNKIVFIGKTVNTNLGYPITLRIFAPNGNQIVIDQIFLLQDGTFRSEYNKNSFKNLGTYKLEILYEPLGKSTYTFEIGLQKEMIITPELSNNVEEQKQSQSFDKIDFQNSQTDVLIIVSIIIIASMVLTIFIAKRKLKFRILGLIPKKGKNKKPFRKKIYEITSKTEATYFSRTTFEIAYSTVNVIATWKTRGLKKINIGELHAEYHFTLKQSSPRPEILQIFEDSLPLDGWQKEKGTRKAQPYVLSGSHATSDEADLFFDKSSSFFKSKLENRGFSVREIT